jgi:hypothetical protein
MKMKHLKGTAVATVLLGCEKKYLDGIKAKNLERSVTA